MPQIKLGIFFSNNTIFKKASFSVPRSRQLDLNIELQSSRSLRAQQKQQQHAQKVAVCGNSNSSNSSLHVETISLIFLLLAPYSYLLLPSFPFFPSIHPKFALSSFILQKICLLLALSFSVRNPGTKKFLSFFLHFLSQLLAATSLLCSRKARKRKKLREKERGKLGNIQSSNPDQLRSVRPTRAKLAMHRKVVASAGLSY